MDESKVCIPVSVDPKGFNRSALLPYSLTTGHIRRAMESFTSFLQAVNRALHSKGLDRLESCQSHTVI